MGHLLLNEYIEQKSDRSRLTVRGEEYTHYTRIK